CDNSCNQTGTGLNVAACPGTDTVLCNAPVLDACGNVCGSTGTGYDAAQCPDAVTVLCASQVTYQCGNPCGAVGTLCPGSSVCGDSGCLDPGQGPENPGLSCLDVVAKGFGAGDGVYWIDPDGAAGDGAFQVWCDMTNGGWTLVLKLSDNDTSSFKYDSGQWSSSEPINSDSLDPDDNVTMKSQAYSTVPFTEIRMDMGSLGNSLKENISRDAARDLFTGGHVNSSYGRTDFFNWVDEPSNFWDTQPHCNVHGFNVTNSSAKCRYGISMNNEGDCNSNDSWVGLGCHHLSAGAVSWNPGATYARQAWVFVR
ncbi:MAG: fibrinogen-like YCDxxxxGGGW domain-containing protein, partial [Myxococcota bacterium]|nr:fibrinogen-like YCDxxxxGGGW domain-containing protein [Myxococcota bacterium]